MQPGAGHPLLGVVAATSWKRPETGKTPPLPTFIQAGAGEERVLHY
jgi:hypothetical protein